MDSKNIIDIDQGDFEKKVIEKSEQKLIIVDFIMTQKIYKTFLHLVVKFSMFQLR